MIIGLTGGSGTGKSTAAEYLVSRGFLIIDCDAVAREITDKGTPCLKELTRVFGESIIGQDGSLLRRTLGDMVFSDREKLDILTSITHKYIIERIHNITEQNKGKNIVIDAPLLFEAGLESICDMLVCVISDRDNRIARICARDGISRESAAARIDSQQNDEFYVSKCDFVVFNNSDKDELLRQLKKIPLGE